MWKSLVVLACVSASLAQALNGSFTVMTYNVAGLPEPFSGSNPSTNTRLISPRLAPYNIINVQEDFHYNTQLYRDDKHPHRTTTSGTIPFGSGLNTLSDFPIIHQQRVTWDDCWINEADCLTPKGFHYVRIRIAEGVFFDFYNLHADAGGDQRDRDARRSNYNQIVKFANERSTGMPIIVMGDTNTIYTRTFDGDTIRNFAQALGLTDSWVRNKRSGKVPLPGETEDRCPMPFPAGWNEEAQDRCEHLDKILVRGAGGITAVPATHKNDNQAFLDSQGKPLSDHYPVVSRIEWTLSSSIRLGDPHGGSGGDHFTTTKTGKLASIIIRTGDRLDSIAWTVTGGSTTTRGGSGGTSTKTLTLDSGERVVELMVCDGAKDSGRRVFYVKLTTDKGRSIEGGTETGTCTTTKGPGGVGAEGKAWGVVGFWGRSGSEVDALGPVWGSV